MRRPRLPGKPRIIQLWQDEMRWAWRNGSGRKVVLTWSVMPVWIAICFVATAIVAIRSQDFGNGAAVFVLFVSAPMIGLGVITYFRFSYRIWAFHPSGATKHRRRQSNWALKPPEYHVGTRWCWARIPEEDWSAVGDRSDAGYRTCALGHLDSKGAVTATEPHSELDCMPPCAGEFTEGPGEPAGVFFQMIDPWELRELNRKRRNPSARQQLVRYGPIAGLTIGMWVIVVLF